MAPFRSLKRTSERSVLLSCCDVRSKRRRVSSRAFRRRATSSLYNHERVKQFLLLPRGFFFHLPGVHSYSRKASTQKLGLLSNERMDVMNIKANDCTLTFLIAFCSQKVNFPSVVFPHIDSDIELKSKFSSLVDFKMPGSLHQIQFSFKTYIPQKISKPYSTNETKNFQLQERFFFF